MKKYILTALFILVTVLLFPVYGLAFEFTVDEPTGLGTEIFNYPADENYITSYFGENNVNIYNLSPGGTNYCLKMDAYAMYEFDAPEEGTYTFVVKYIAREGTNRGLDYALNDPDGKNRIFIDLPESNSEQYVIGTFEITSPGKNQFYLYAPTNMDDVTLKSCDIYNVALYFTAPIVTETEAPANTEAEAPAETGIIAAPQTSDFVTGIAAVLAVAGSAAALCLRKKR
jgi:hypothetical protein